MYAAIGPLAMTPFQSPSIWKKFCCAKKIIDHKHYSERDCLDQYPERRKAGNLHVRLENER
jgi:hypothetical protein